jgi:hypothetical protein
VKLSKCTVPYRHLKSPQKVDHLTTLNGRFLVTENTVCPLNYSLSHMESDGLVQTNPRQYSALSTSRFSKPSRPRLVLLGSDFGAASDQIARLVCCMPCCRVQLPCCNGRKQVKVVRYLDSTGQAYHDGQLHTPVLHTVVRPYSSFSQAECQSAMQH